MKIAIALLVFTALAVLFGASSRKLVAGGTTVTARWDVVINFDDLNGAQIQEAEAAAKYARKTDSVKWVIVRNILAVRKIDVKRIADKPDSLKINSTGIFLKLKPLKK